METKMQPQHGFIEPHPEHHHEVHVREVEIHVNERPVRMMGHRHTGLEIKQAAIAQGVKIEPDFLLYLERHHQPNKPIEDDEEVTITDESRFDAIADDDNS
jgi:Multiubiquitin